ncbi:MAG: YicC family protein [Gammaproteobacteria bacterium]|nr:YicC family protein [Gammaproteobacteria bacterium]
MPLSMTAFARREADTPWGELIWELRSVNHRYLELALRLPEELRRIEPKVREQVSKRLGRGKVDLGLRFQTVNNKSDEFEVDEDMLARLLGAAAKISAIAPTAPLSAMDLLRWQGVLKTPAIDLDTLQEQALGLLDQALDELIDTRGREGGRLKQIIEQRLSAMADIVAQVKQALPEIMENFRSRIKSRLEEIKQQLDPERLEQEIALFAQKTDVDEELDRLETHLQEVTRVINKKGPIGRRLDFLMQELNREANTLGSKATDIRLTNASVDLKVLIEQMREQVQNIE